METHPYRFQERMEWNLSHTMMPGVVAMVMMLLAVALTADQLVTEKEEGLLTRDYVCGVGLPVYLAAQITVISCSYFQHRLHADKSAHLRVIEKS